MTGPAAPDALPAPVQLARVVAAVRDDLASRWPALLAEDRWAEAAGGLSRLGEPGAVERLGRELGGAECERLAALLLTRWDALGGGALPPAAAVVGAGPERTVVVDGLEPGWTTSWHGPTVRVFGRTAAGRTILTATADDAGSGDEGSGDAAD